MGESGLREGERKKEGREFGGGFVHWNDGHDTQSHISFTID